MSLPHESTAGRGSASASASAGVRRRIIPSGVLAILLVIIAQMMFFSALISAYMITETASAEVGWPPPGQPPLPVRTTAFNSGALVLSAVALFLAARLFARKSPRARGALLVATVLGAYFAASQIVLGTGLVSAGLTMTTSNNGAFFYLIVGVHTLDAIAGVVALALVTRQIWRGTLPPSRLWASEVFWYFVVGLWPALYFQVYV